MRYFIPLLVIAMADGVSSAQPAKSDKKPLDGAYLRDHAATRGFMLGRPVKATPTPDGKAVLFLRSEARKAQLSLCEFDVASGKTRELLTPAQVLKGAEEKLSAEEKARRERMRVSVGGFTGLQLSRDGRLILLSLSGKLYVVERVSKDIRELTTGEGSVIDPKFSPDGKMVSYVRDHDIYVLDLATGKERRLTTGGTREVPHGLAEFVAQEEMYRYTGYWWSPDSKRIVYQETDNRGVEVWHVADPIHPDQEPTPFFYPRPGKANAKVRLGVIDVKGGPTTWIHWDADKYPYLTSVNWPQGGPLTIGVQTRDQTEWLLLQVDPASGKTTVLLRERDTAWVNLRQDMPHWLPDGNGFFWVSERDGGPQLELRGKNGRMKGVVVPAGAGFIELADYDPKTDQVYFIATTDPTQARFYRIGLTEALAGEEQPVAVSDEVGLHSAVFARNHAVYVRTSRTLGEMPRSQVFKADGTPLGELPS